MRGQMTNTVLKDALEDLNVCYEQRYFTILALTTLEADWG